jgi:hypothetical protein
MKTQQVIALCAMLIIGAGRSSPALAAARAYINAYKQIILYFDAPLNIPDATNVGLAGVTVNNAALYNTTTDPDFAKSLFAAMLAAQARGSTISVQMMSVSGGYLVIDRIWVDQ